MCDEIIEREGNGRSDGKDTTLKKKNDFYFEYYSILMRQNHQTRIRILKSKNKNFLKIFYSQPRSREIIVRWSLKH